jgi:hypothetical protein
VLRKKSATETTRLTARVDQVAEVFSLLFEERGEKAVGWIIGWRSAEMARGVE